MTMYTNTCKVCGATFERNRKQDHCSRDCSKITMAEKKTGKKYHKNTKDYYAEDEHKYSRFGEKRFCQHCHRYIQPRKKSETLTSYQRKKYCTLVCSAEVNASLNGSLPRPVRISSHDNFNPEAQQFYLGAK